MNYPIIDLDDEQFEDLLLLEPREMYDKCVLGVVERFNDRFVLYSKRCVLAALAETMDDDPDTDQTAEDDAVEWYEYNMRGAFVGEATPGFLEDDGDE